MNNCPYIYLYLITNTFIILVAYCIGDESVIEPVHWVMMPNTHVYGFKIVCQLT